MKVFRHGGDLRAVSMVRVKQDWVRQVASRPDLRQGRSPLTDRLVFVCENRQDPGGVLIQVLKETLGKVLSLVDYDVTPLWYRFRMRLQGRQHRFPNRSRTCRAQ